ncbi:MAG: ABC transporter ATP-binding protein [Candidatus Rokubacteria bacterium]|nr:ABC transporter ATP-binding protein [Candidatus Rokubacteria bacterium]
MGLSPAVEIRDLEKSFRSGWPRRRVQPALRGVTFSVPRGAIFAILGPNGAGKTTLLSILATLLLPDRGTARVLGHDVVREPHRVRERVNMSSGNANFLWSLTPREILDIFARLAGVTGRVRRVRVEALLDLLELRGHAEVPYSELSTGLKQRLALAKALVNEPELLILDEPTLGLDPDVSVRIRAQIAALRRERGTTILLSTHYMREAEELADEIVFLRDGRILARGDADTLKRRIKVGDAVSLVLADPAAWERLRALSGVLACASRDGRVECVVDDARKRLPDLLRHLHEAGVEVHDLRVTEPDLEAVFLELAR